ncbi:DUF5682 family protein [Deinococcus sp.]|uniref:DUF5682 family protein n=1 Tax=Deinococcus sp. TaxID=47478 RepID=UPI003B59F337
MASESSYHIYPIRHHGPGSARSLERALSAAPPEVLLIEGPSDADALLPFLNDPALTPPVALMAHVQGHPERAVFYPLAEFSPEFVAIRWALGRGIPVAFMDLPAAVTLAQREQEAEASEKADPDVESPDSTQPEESETAPDELRSDPLAALARAAGYPDFERWWDQLVEARSDDAAVFDAVAEVMTAVRETEETQERDLLREAHMRQRIREAQKGGQSLAVVCGAWHTPALTAEVLSCEKKADAALLKSLPRAKIGLTLVPWTHGRLTASSGYGAGVTSPGWCAHLFNTSQHVSASWLIRSARLLREAKLDASSAQVIDATRLAETLASLRGLGLPGLHELTDATRAVFAWESDLPLRLISEQLIVGETLGEVPSGVPSVPLAQDLAAQQKRLRLKVEATARELILDLREDGGLERSQLLHRLNLLGIPWGVAAHISGAGTFKEGWTLRWEPEFSVRVVEASLHGNTLVRAANTVASSRARRAKHLGELSELLEVTRLSNLPDAARLTLGILDTRAADADVSELLGALPPLARLARYGDVRTRNGDDAAPIFRTLVLRAGAGLPNAAQTLSDEAAESLQRIIAAADGAVRLLDDEQASTDWRSALQALDQTEQIHPLLHGDAVRRLRDGGALDEAEVQARVVFALAPGGPVTAVSAWLDGFLGEQGGALLHDAALLTLLDAWVSTLDPDAFETVLPPLRRSLSRLEAAERRRIGEDLRGLERQQVVRDVNDELGMLVIPVGLRLLGLTP